MTMTTSQETMTDAARRSQDAMNSVMQMWTDTFQKFLPVSDTSLRGAMEAVDGMYDFAEQILLTQREFAKSVLAATTSAATKAAYATQDAAKDMDHVAKDMQESVNSQR
jgi:hypothetical protein